MEISESLINGESGNYLRIREIGRETSFPLTMKGVKSKLNVKIAKNSFKGTILACFFAISAAALEGCNGCNCTRRFLGKTLGKTKLHPSIFGKDHRLHPSIENPKAAADIIFEIWRHVL